jgi:uncharacterized surface protein with fasciclin (FAS1) repeats
MLLITSCQKKFGEFYERPEGLGAPIYQQLEEKGDFKELTAVIDKAGYKKILSETGWWTFFAPNDQAFQKFYQERGISGVDGISDSLANSIVKYLLVFNSYREDQLSTFQQGGDNSVGVGMAFKRKTAYYDWVNQDGDQIHAKIISTNRNVTSERSGSIFLNKSNYKDGDNNNKYIPYFTTLFLETNNLQDIDYKSFYPNIPLTGFNVADAVVDVAAKNIAAENGTIHVIDKVITPIPSIDQYIRSKPQYSEFTKLLDSLAFYTVNPYVTNKNTVVTGSTENVYTKGYNGRLAFSPNNESYQIPATASFFNTISQREGYTILVPTNAVLDAYRKKILKNYGNTFFSNTPASVLTDFINSLMWGNTLWPSLFKTNLNFLEEEIHIDFANAVDRKMLSNGVLYGIDKIHETNVFRTVYGVPYLDPATRLTYNGFNEVAYGLKSYTSQPAFKQTVLIMPDNLLAANGWRYNESSAGASTSAWGYQAPSATSYNHNNVHRENITRMFATGVLLTPDAEITSFAGEGIVETKSGDYIKYKNGVLQTSGSQDAGQGINVIKTNNESVNGIAYYVDNMLKFTENNVGFHLEKLATQYPNEYGDFYFIVSNTTTIYTASTKAITGLKTGIDDKYTIFSPSNAAIVAAVKAGLLPGNTTTGVLKRTGLNVVDIESMRKFVLYHIINGETVAIDGKKSDTYLSMLQKDDGSPILIDVSNTPSQLVVQGKTPVGGLGYAKTISDKSNQLSNRSLIHAIDSYLNYQ